MSQVLMLGLMWLSGIDSQLHISQTEIFQAISIHDAAVHPNGSVYLLNLDQRKIQMYGPDGKLVKKIGGQGSGPGEFLFPAYFALRGDRLYLFDMPNAKVSVYDLQGTFLAAHKSPFRQGTLQRGKAGWLYFPQTDIEGGPSELFWADDTLAKTQSIKPIAHTGWALGTWAVGSPEGMSLTFSPLDTRGKLISSPDGRFLFFVDPNVFKIDVYDGETGKLLRQISRNDGQLPFDLDWANEAYVEQTKGSTKDFPGTKIKKLYPEKFPVIRDLKIDPQGNLVIDRWRGQPKNNHAFICLTPEGKEVPVSYDWEVLRRYIGRVKDTAYVLMFDGEEVGIATVPIDELNTFVKNNPNVEE